MPDLNFSERTLASSEIKPGVYFRPHYKRGVHLVRNATLLKTKNMSSFEPFRPDFQFSVPPNPFPPGAGWESTLEMVKDVYEDLKLPWVQDFILRSHPRQDVHALSEPNNYSRAISNIFSGKSIPALSDGFDVSTLNIRLDVPVISIGNIGVGLGVENTNIEGLDIPLPFQNYQFFRSVSNNRKNSMLILRFQEELGTIGCQYMVHNSNGLWQFCHLMWDDQSFQGAFDKKSSKVDFHLLHQSLKQSIIGGIQRSRKPTIITNHLYPNKIADNTGDYFLPIVMGAYANGHLLSTLPIFYNASWSYNYNAVGLRSIQRWGIMDRLNKIKSSPVQERLIQDNILLDENTQRLMEEDSNNNDHNTMSVVAFLTNKRRVDNGETAGPTPVAPAGSWRAGVINIAPLPQPLPELDGGLDAKKEMRKIRKRESAARSYRRKLARSKKQLRLSVKESTG